jgi:squalene synthase HpnC
MATAFATELARWGPHRDYPAPTPGHARAYCRRLALTHYENFSVASLFVPRRLLRHFHNIYAFCRWSDDLADETAGGDAALRLLSWWRDELSACYAGRARHPVFIALAETIGIFAIPPEPFTDLISAFEQDQRVKSYATFADLLDYCRRSADPVGRLVLRLGRCHTPDNVALSDRICTALQLTNFWQDVARDLDIGRVYLPADDRARFGFADADLHARRATREFRELMRFEVDRARSMFMEGLPLADRVPRELRVQIELFARGGLAILDRIVTQEFDVWSRRPTLSKLDKAAIMARAVARRAGWNR